MRINYQNIGKIFESLLDEYAQYEISGYIANIRDFTKQELVTIFNNLDFIKARLMEKLDITTLDLDSSYPDMDSVLIIDNN